MVVGFLRSSSSSNSNAAAAAVDDSRAAHMHAPTQSPAQTIAMHHQHLQLQAQQQLQQLQPLATLRGAPGASAGGKRPFQELPRLHVPSHALAQQAQPMWKSGSVIMPSSLGLVSGASASPPPPPPAAPRFQFFTNTVGGWFGRSSAPAKALPSFHEILARTNQLQIVGQDDADAAQQQQQVAGASASAGDVEMLGPQEQMQMQLEQQHQAQQQQALAAAEAEHLRQQQLQHMQLQQQQQQQQALSMPFPPSAAPPSYTAFAPQAMPLQANEALAQRPSLSVVGGAGGGGAEAASPSSLASPAASVAGDASKRRERWTEDEHARFMEGLNRYGRKWKKIQTFVQTKTAVQVRTHAYGYFAKLLRNMPEDDGVWELAEEMSSLPGAVLKGPGNGKRRNEPKTDEQGMDVLRRFVFSKKKSDEKKAAQAAEGESAADEGDAAQQQQADQHEPRQDQHEQQQQQSDAPFANWSIVEDSAASSAMLELKRQRIM